MLIHLFISSRKALCFFYWGCERQMYKTKRETKANKETKEKAAIGSVPLVWCCTVPQMIPNRK